MLSQSIYLHLAKAFTRPKPWLTFANEILPNNQSNFRFHTLDKQRSAIQLHDVTA